MSNAGFPSHCSLCNRKGVRIVSKKPCSNCHRVVQTCMGCQASLVNGLRKSLCKCSNKKKRRKSGPFV
jgi:hypothetical protein